MGGAECHPERSPAPEGGGAESKDLSPGKRSFDSARFAGSAQDDRGNRQLAPTPRQP